MPRSKANGSSLQVEGTWLQSITFWFSSAFVSIPTIREGVSIVSNTTVMAANGSFLQDNTRVHMHDSTVINGISIEYI